MLSKVKKALSNNSITNDKLLNIITEACVVEKTLDETRVKKLVLIIRKSKGLGFEKKMIEHLYHNKKICKVMYKRLMRVPNLFYVDAVTQKYYEKAVKNPNDILISSLYYDEIGEKILQNSSYPFSLYKKLFTTIKSIDVYDISKEAKYFEKIKNPIQKEFALEYGYLFHSRENLINKALKLIEKSKINRHVEKEIFTEMCKYGDSEELNYYANKLDFSENEIGKNIVNALYYECYDLALEISERYNINEDQIKFIEALIVLRTKNEYLIISKIKYFEECASHDPRFYFVLFFATSFLNKKNNEFIKYGIICCNLSSDLLNFFNVSLEKIDKNYLVFKPFFIEFQNELKEHVEDLKFIFSNIKLYDIFQEDNKFIDEYVEKRLVLNPYYKPVADLSKFEIIRFESFYELFSATKFVKLAGDNRLSDESVKLYLEYINTNGVETYLQKNITHKSDDVIELDKLVRVMLKKGILIKDKRILSLNVSKEEYFRQIKVVPIDCIDNKFNSIIYTIIFKVITLKLVGIDSIKKFCISELFEPLEHKINEVLLNNGITTLTYEEDLVHIPDAILKEITYSSVVDTKRNKNFNRRYLLDILSNSINWE